MLMLMLSMYDNEQYSLEALKAGASGYVLKSVADQDLVEACHAAVRGESFLHPGVVSALARSYLDRMRRGEALPTTVLTSREDEGVKRMAEGHSSNEIAQRLRISIKTVELHRFTPIIVPGSVARELDGG